ncbi:hypothetical protein L211DRAFT_837318, partial [Terfezia boudieri ATCC MYA-4762]
MPYGGWPFFAYRMGVAKCVVDHNIHMTCLPSTYRPNPDTSCNILMPLMSLYFTWRSSRVRGRQLIAGLLTAVPHTLPTSGQYPYIAQSVRIRSIT